MTPDTWLLGLLTEADVATLCDADPILLGADASARSGTEWLTAVLEVIDGRRGYEQRIRAALDAQERGAALELAASAAVRRRPLAEEITGLVEVAWGQMQAEAQTARRNALSLLDNHAFGTSGLDELRELAALLRVELEAATLPDVRPGVPAAVRAALAVAEQIRGHESEAKELVAELQRERTERDQRVRALTVSAASKLAERLFDPDAEKRSLAADILRALPDLANDGRVDDLQTLNGGALDPAFRVEFRPAPRRPRSVPAPAIANATRSTAPTPLSRVSESAIAGVGIIGTAVASADDLRRIRTEADVPNPRRRARILLGASRRADAPPLVNALQGEGLLATAEQYLFEDGNARMAQFCASDAIACLVASGEHYVAATAQEAVATLLLCRLWPKIQARVHKGAVNLAALRRDLTKLMAWIEEQGELEAVGQLWSHESASVARELLETMSVFASSTQALWTACAFALVRHETLLDVPEASIDKVIGLLAPAHPSRELRDALQGIARELAAADRRRIESASRNAVLRHLDVVCAELDKLPLSPPAPLVAVIDRLPAVVRNLVDAPSTSASPQIAITKPIGAIFLDDRAEEVRIPVVIENDPKATPARDLHVQVSFDPESAALIDLLEPHEQPLAQIDPGESDERSFYCTLRRRAATLTRADLRVVVRSGLGTIAKSTISVTLRHESRRHRKSPYQPGLPLEIGESFVGRERQLKTLTDALLADAVRVPLVVGIRRVGKTSLLHAVMRDPRITAHYEAKYFSVESRPVTDTSVNLLLYLAETLRELLAASVGRAAAAALHFARDEFRADPYAAFERFTAAIEALKPKRALLLVIDEFDKLLWIIEEGRKRAAARGAPLQPNDVLQPEVLGALRAMIMCGRSIRVMIAGLPRLLREMGYEHRFFGMLEPVHVAGFKEEEAKKVMGFAEPVVRFTSQAQTRALQASGGQPYLLQVICHGLFTYMLEEGRDVTTRQDVDEVLERSILPNQSYFTDFMELMDGENLALVRTIAQLQHDAPSRLYVAIAEIEHALTGAGMAVPSDLRARLDDLTKEDRPLLERPLKQIRYRLSIGILGDHLLR